MKKVFISADLEGVTGVTGWAETRYGGQGYEEACRRMTLEVKAACDAAVALGFRVVVKDGHEDARNIDPEQLPRGAELIRGWRTSPAAMMGGLDNSFAAALYIGYHSAEGSDTSPLAHTIEHDLFSWIKLDGKLASEFTLNALWAAAYGVPSVFLSGDQGICDAARQECPGIGVCATKVCTGDSTWNIHPAQALEEIGAGVREALGRSHPTPALRDSYTLEIRFREHQRARCASWYPGAKLLDPCTVAYTAQTPMELMTAKMFMTGI